MAPKTSENSDARDRVVASIDHICTELNLAPLVREKSIELASILKPESAAGNEVAVDVSESVANAVASAIVSMAHEEARRMGRVPRHLPDRIVGKIYGLSSAAVVYNKHLINSVITKKKVEMQKGMPRQVRTLR